MVLQEENKHMHYYGESGMKLEFKKYLINIRNKTLEYVTISNQDV